MAKIRRAVLTIHAGGSGSLLSMINYPYGTTFLTNAMEALANMIFSVH